MSCRPFALQRNDTKNHRQPAAPRDQDISDIAVHIASRVMDHADDGQIWVLGVVPLLMAGSNVEFEPRGESALKGVPGEWPPFAAKA